MIEAGIVISGLLIVSAIYGAYAVGKAVGRDVRRRQACDLVTERAVRHNLNCLVGDLRHEVVVGQQYKADALAYNQSKGVWCTDEPDLIKHHAKKERFFRLGYPEHKL